MSGTPKYFDAIAYRREQARQARQKQQRQQEQQLKQKLRSQIKQAKNTVTKISNASHPNILSRETDTLQKIKNNTELLSLSDNTETLKKNANLGAEYIRHANKILSIIRQRNNILEKISSIKTTDRKLQNNTLKEKAKIKLSKLEELKNNVLQSDNNFGEIQKKVRQINHDLIELTQAQSKLNVISQYVKDMQDKVDISEIVKKTEENIQKYPSDASVYIKTLFSTVEGLITEQIKKEEQEHRRVLQEQLIKRNTAFQQILTYQSENEEVFIHAAHAFVTVDTAEVKYLEIIKMLFENDFSEECFKKMHNDYKAEVNKLLTEISEHEQKEEEFSKKQQENITELIKILDNVTPLTDSHKRSKEEISNDIGQISYENESALQARCDNLKDRITQLSEHINISENTKDEKEFTAKFLRYLEEAGQEHEIKWDENIERFNSPEIGKTYELTGLNNKGESITWQISLQEEDDDEVRLSMSTEDGATGSSCSAFKTVKDKMKEDGHSGKYMEADVVIEEEIESSSDYEEKGTAPEEREV